MLVATVAFGVGVDAPNIHCSIHWGCSDSIDAYIQESGRCGRDGERSFACLYYSKRQLSRKRMDDGHIISEEMRIYYTNQLVCRRNLLMRAFEDNPHFEQPKPIHQCCDVCAHTCSCSNCAQAQATAMSSVEFEAFVEADAIDDSPSVLATGAHVQRAVIDRLTAYRDSLCEDTPVIFGQEIVTCLPDSLIRKIGRLAANITHVSDLLDLGVVSIGVAQDIIDIIQHVN